MNETQTKKKSYKEVMDELLEQFKDGSLPDAVARSYTAFPDVPCSKYSLTNRVLILSEHTNDARGYKQWQTVGRQVKKGKKAFYIFTPKIKIVKKKDESKKTLDNGQQKEKEKKCTGFRLIPMFRYEDTEGSEIPEHIRPATLPPLIDVAEKAGIEVNWSKTEHGEYGYFSPKYNSISLACDNPTVFFHELVHAYDNKNTQLKNGQDPVQECVAEFGACVLARMFGIRVDKGSYNYIESYDKNVPDMCKKVLSRVDGIIKAILADNEAKMVA